MAQRADQQQAYPQSIAMNAPMVRISIYTESTRNKGKSRQESRGTATATDRLQASNTCSKAIGGGSEPPSVWKHAAADRCVGGTGGLEPGVLRTKARRSDSVWMSSAASLTFPVFSFKLFRTLVASAPLSIDRKSVG